MDSIGCERPDAQPPGQPSVLESAGEVRAPTLDEALSTSGCRDERRIAVASFTFAAVATLILALAGGTYFVTTRTPLIRNVSIEAIVDRIIVVESNGSPSTKNKRSSATGAGQFLDQTWLELMRRHRGNLVQGLSEKEVLELRRDPELSRAIITRLAEQNATMLKKRGLPVTPVTLYLAHFAGPAGAVAILSGSDNADAAALMASADSTGRTTREKLVNANPFLKALTVGEIKTWATRKMRS